ncbi:MAG TPA: 23S rRNA pseudouridine(1911/1915/1917) synthase RluD [Spongiibacteraceae bacterium]|nr:23S rRNA pseudouridine(1911/1915/1917) synthase RluD [Spongiibacteraceae bacterium]
MSATPRQRIQLQRTVPPALGGRRFDQIAADLFPDYSRARLQVWIKTGELTVDSQLRQPKDKLASGAVLALRAELHPVDETWQPEAIDLSIVFEDEDILVIDKPAGLVVHPAAGHADGTLLNALLHHCPDLNLVPRAGIVHRLDKDTTGLMVVAKNLTAQAALVAQLQARDVHREYEAIATGVLVSGGTVNVPLGRHPRDRKRQAVVSREGASSGKEAITHYRVLKRFRAHTHIRCLLETGRTHQIRVHMAHIRHPLLGDPVYGGRFKKPAGASAELIELAKAFPRQALHARRLELRHPRRAETLSWEAPLPEDMRELLAMLAADSEQLVR